MGSRLAAESYHLHMTHAADRADPPRRAWNWLRSIAAHFRMHVGAAEVAPATRRAPGRHR